MTYRVTLLLVLLWAVLWAGQAFGSCLHSAAAVKEKYPGSWPSYHGVEHKCWFPTWRNKTHVASVASSALKRLTPPTKHRPDVKKPPVYMDPSYPVATLGDWINELRPSFSVWTPASFERPFDQRWGKWSIRQ